MQSKIYRFEILRALTNAVFEVKDPMDGSTAFLYEWTPAPVDRDAAKKRLEEVSEELTCEVFTAEASLYVAATSRALGHDALNTLRTHGLFPGEWLDDPVKVPPPPPPPQKPEVVRIEPEPRNWTGIVVMMLVAMLVAYLIGSAVETSQAESNAQTKIRAVTDSMEAEKKQLQDQLNNQSATAQGTASALATYSGTQVIRIKNDCRKTIRVAVDYVDYNQQHVVKGWTELSTGETSILAASPSADFGFYAESMDGSEFWEENSGTAISVTTENFIYLTSSPLSGESVKRVYPRHIRVNASGYPETLDCPK